MRHWAFAAVSLLMVIAVSGCTVPPQLCIVPGLCGGGKSELANDVIVLKSVEALPSKVSPGQQVKLHAYVENIGNKAVNKDSGGVTVSLYDTCGLFDEITVSCPKGSQPKDTGEARCEDVELLPHQTKEVSWTLRARSDIKLKSQCELKIYAKYNYATESETSVAFINYEEYQKELDEGRFKRVASYISEGYGPVKPYLVVEDQQPIPVEKGRGGTLTLGFQLKNRGSGFISGKNVINKEKVAMSATNIGDSYNIVDNAQGTTQTDNKNIFNGLKNCLEEKAKDGFTFIGKETPKIICQIPLPDKINIPKQTTVYVRTEVKYSYEFRKSVRVVIEPKT